MECALSVERECKEGNTHPDKKNTYNIHIGLVNGIIVSLVIIYSITKNSRFMYKQSVEIFFTFYRFHTKETYTMDGQQGKHLKQLLKKIESKVKEKGMEPTEDNILNSLKGFLNCVKDPWILEHLEISLLNSKFNVLYSHAIKHSPLQATQRINDIVENRYGSEKSAEK